MELREEMELHDNKEKSVNGKIYMPVQSKTMTKKEESKDKFNLNDRKNHDENHQKLSWVTNNPKQRKKKKAC